MSESSWLDNYNWLQPIGEGGMGAVYLAEDKRNNNAPCVIKQIKYEYKDLASQAEMIKVCQREADLLRKLNHRGIVKFLDDHYSVEGLYVVMEYIPGQNLEVVMNKEGPLDSETVVRIALQCCDVLEYLHSAEPPIIYRDLKPSNLMLRTDGLVVFIDFGIARDFEPQGPATRVVTSGYSPPEQYFGKPEPRGDLYSLGATMHHLLTGIRPKPLTACHPKNLNGRVLPALDALIFQLTSHDRDERPPSARAVQYELFQIYKSLHEEFEIPELGIEEDREEDEREKRDDVVNSARLRSVRNPRTKSGAPSFRVKRSDLESKANAKIGTNDVDDTESGGMTGLFARLRQWVEDMKGNR